MRHLMSPLDFSVEELDQLLVRLKGEELPVNREEFEARAVLFYILMQIHSLLEVKRAFLLDRS